MTGPLNSSVPTSSFVIGGVYNLIAPAPITGQVSAVQLDANGNLLVNIAAGAASGTQYVDGTTQATPTGTVALGKNPSNVLHSLSLDASGNLNINIAAGSSSGVQYATGTVVATPTGTASLGWDGTNVRVLSTDSSGRLAVNVNGTVPVSIAAIVSENLSQANGVALGSPSAYGTTPGAVNVLGVNAFITNTPAVTLTSTTITGTVSENLTQVGGSAVTLGTKTSANSIPVVLASDEATLPVSIAATVNVSVQNATLAVTQSTSPWVVSGDSASGAAKAGNPVQTGGVFNTVQPTVISGQTVEDQSTARGARIVAVGVDGFAVTLASTAITGTVAVTQSTSPWVVSGGLTNNNAAPSANNVGALTVLSNAANPTFTEGDLTLFSQDLSGYQRVNVGKWGGTALGTPTNFGTTPGAVIAGSANASLFIGTTVATASAAGVLKVGISGNAAATLDSVITAATAPANGLAILVENVTTAPSLTTGQSVMAQSDYQGNLFVKPYRRGQTVSQATTITNSTTITTILAAQAAGIFADITSLVITVTPAATGAGGLDTAFTATLTGAAGTGTYIFDLDTGAVGTATIAGGPPTGINITFNPPLAAATAATVWQLTLSVLGVTAHVVVNAVLQKAS